MKLKATAGKSFTFKSVLFGYLAASKVFYWMEKFSEMETLGDFATSFINRMLSRDIMLIIILAGMFYLEDRISSRHGEGRGAVIRLYAIGVTIFSLFIVANTLVVEFLFEPFVENWVTYILGYVGVFLLISLVLHLKDNVKKKEAESYQIDTDNPETQCAMLRSLCEKGILTDDECESKIKQLSP